MSLLKRKPDMTPDQLTQLMSLREVFRSTNCGEKVCIVTDKEAGWEHLLGNYYNSLINRVTTGQIYCKILNNQIDQLTEDDLTNLCVEIL